MRGGSLVPLEGDAQRRIPEKLRATTDYATRMGRFEHRRARASWPRWRSRARRPRRASSAHFRQKPDWDLPFLVEPLLGGPLSYPFEGPGSEAGWAARETPSGTRLVGDYRARVAENWVLRWLGGMTSRALSEFRAGAEREADRFHGECLVGAARRPGRGAGRQAELRTTGKTSDNGQGMDNGTGPTDWLTGLKGG